MARGRPRKERKLGDPTPLREKRRANADLNRMLRGEVDWLVEQALTYDAIRTRPGLVRIIRRGEYGAAGRMLLALQRAGQNGDEAAGLAARGLSDTVEAIRERAGEERMETHPVFAPDIYEPPKRKGRPRSPTKDWSWVAEYERKISARVDTGTMTMFEERTRALAITAVRRAHGVHPSDFAFVSPLFNAVVPSAKKALLERQVAGVRSTGRTVARNQQDGRYVREAVRRAVEARAEGREIPAPVDAALERYVGRVMALLMRPVPTN